MKNGVSPAAPELLVKILALIPKNLKKNQSQGNSNLW